MEKNDFLCQKVSIFLEMCKLLNLISDVTNERDPFELEKIMIAEFGFPIETAVIGKGSHLTFVVQQNRVEPEEWSKETVVHVLDVKICSKKLEVSESWESFDQLQKKALAAGVGYLSHEVLDIFFFRFRLHGDFMCEEHRSSSQNTPALRGWCAALLAFRWRAQVKDFNQGVVNDLWPLVVRRCKSLSKRSTASMTTTVKTQMETIDLKD